MVRGAVTGKERRAARLGHLDAACRPERPPFGSRPRPAARGPQPDTLFGPLLARTPGRDAGRDFGEKYGLGLRWPLSPVRRLGNSAIDPSCGPWCGIGDQAHVSARRRGCAQQKESGRVGICGLRRCPGRPAWSPAAGTAQAPPRPWAPPFGSAAARFVVSRLVSACLGLSRLCLGLSRLVSAFSAKKCLLIRDTRRHFRSCSLLCSIWGGHGCGGQGGIAHARGQTLRHASAKLGAVRTRI